MSILAELESLSPYEPIDAEPEPANDVPMRRKRGRPSKTNAGQQWFDDWRCPCPECCARYPERAARAAERSARAAKAAKKARKGPRP